MKHTTRRLSGSGGQATSAGGRRSCSSSRSRPMARRSTGTRSELHNSWHTQPACCTPADIHGLPAGASRPSCPHPRSRGALQPLADGRGGGRGAGLDGLEQPAQHDAVAAGRLLLLLPHRHHRRERLPPRGAPAGLEWHAGGRHATPCVGPPDPSMEPPTGTWSAFRLRSLKSALAEELIFSESLSPTDTRLPPRAPPAARRPAKRARGGGAEPRKPRLGCLLRQGRRRCARTRAVPPPHCVPQRVELYCFDNQKVILENSTASK